MQQCICVEARWIHSNTKVWISFSILYYIQYNIILNTPHLHSGVPKLFGKMDSKGK